MVTPYTPYYPPSSQPPFAATPPAPPVSPTKTSGALVFNFFQPVSNYAEGAPAANDNFQRNGGIGSYGSQASAGAYGTSGAYGSQASATAYGPQGAPVTQPNPFANPQQQLIDAYNQALNARNNAEQLRDSYLNLANQLNGQAYQTQTQPSPYGAPGMGYPPQDPMAQWQQQQAQLAQQQYLQQMQQQQAQQQYLQQLQQQQAQQQYLQQLQQQQALQQPPQMQQPPIEQPSAPQQQKPLGLENASIEELNRMIANPQTLQEEVDAMEEIGVRGQGTAETYELLKQSALADTSAIPPGQAQDDANYVRQAALWTLGMLNKAQGSQTPTKDLPGLRVIEQIIKNKNENPDVKAAAIQALQVIGRLDDKRIKSVLKKASKDKNPDVQRLANEALSGKTIPLPSQGGGNVVQFPGGGGAMPPGVDPSQMQMAAFR